MREIWRRFRDWLTSSKDSPPEPTLEEFQAVLATTLEDFLAILPEEYAKPDCFVVGHYWLPALIQMGTHYFMNYYIRVDRQIKDQTVFLKGEGRANASNMRDNKRQVGRARSNR